MRVGHLEVARPNYYDRLVAVASFTYGSTVLAPAAQTIRATYTVPTGHRAYWESAGGWLSRASAAGALGRARIFHRWTPFLLSVGHTVLMTVLFANNIGDHAEQSQTDYGVLGAADIATIETFDDSTGGSVEYTASGKVTEYTA